MSIMILLTIILTMFILTITNDNDNTNTMFPCGPKLRSSSVQGVVSIRRNHLSNTTCLTQAFFKVANNVAHDDDL